jgi:hypothetical protein
MTIRWMPTLLTIALLLVGSGYGQTTQAAPLASSPASTQHLLLSDDLLDRMMAVARERRAIEQAHPASDEEDDSDDGDDTGVPTIASMASRMDADPATRALLARHGFTGQSYLLAMSTLAHAGAQARMAGTKWASKTPGAATVDPRNISFYKQHAAKISALNALNNPDYSPEEEARITRKLRNIDPEDMDDCVLLVPSVASLTPHAMPGSTEASPSSRIELANATAKLAEHFHSEQLKKDFTLMADEIRRHAHAKRMDSTPLNNALGRVNDWAADRCTGDEK